MTKSPNISFSLVAYGLGLLASLLILSALTSFQVELKELVLYSLISTVNLGELGAFLFNKPMIALYGGTIPATSKTSVERMLWAALHGGILALLLVYVG